MSSPSQSQEIRFKKGFEEDNFIPNLLSFTDPIFWKGQFQTENYKAEIDASAKFLKRVFDIVFSFCVLVFGSPVFLILLLITKVTSKGPAFYTQERIGENGIPFKMYKFRSMCVDAEKSGVKTTTDNDPRITKWGSFMRKTHLDEFPQFWNVWAGDMSIVGPRPERQYFIDQIVRKAPSFLKLQAIKPGITSVGQIDYGYAETVDEMCERMLIDLQYLNEVNIQKDITIIIGTVKKVFKRNGK
ncbi:sugar transferase [Pararhodonellum marinum]|uniref:sugar transferase n=1 Tax=Pararhodonellum marinum TaxID=2755358 RepID=UPI00188FB0C0|nr:sugar transferase [Pararhodonellum marinum]